MEEDLLLLFADKLRVFANGENLISRALEGCEVAIRNCQLSEIELGIRPLNGWDFEQIQKRFVKHSLVFEYEGKESPYIETLVELFVRKPHKTKNKIKEYESVTEWPIGTYRFITSTNGVHDDDFLIFDADA